MNTTIALHGDFSSGQRFRRDAGDPDWVQWWPDWKRIDLQGWLSNHWEPYVLIGYSRGGSEIADLLNVEAIRERTLGVVLYESPVLKRPPPEGLGIPAVQLWNDYQMSARRREEKTRSVVAWMRSADPVTYLQGHGRHTKWVPYWPYRGHGWDAELNTTLGDWIARICTDTAKQSQ